MENIIVLIFGILIGAVALLLLLFKMAPKYMFLENEVAYNMENAEQVIIKKVSELGWKMPAIHDMQNTMKNNGHEVLPIKIYEICKPDIAVKVLRESDERITSSLMPCRISIYQKENGKVYVSRLNAGLFAKPLNKIIRDAMSKASDETEEIIKSLIK